MSRSVIRIGGEDRLHFLQNLVTNDVTHLDRGPAYAALLTPQGKYLADFFLIGDGETILLDAHAALAPGLIQRLTMYRLRAKVTIEAANLAVRRGTGPAPGGAVIDPRHSALGWRLYGAESGDDGTDWAAIRVEHLIPEYPDELVPNDSYILEWQLDRLHGVDFRKGCYVGQEVTARMKHKTELRKGLARVLLTGPAATGDKILTADGREAGVIGTVSGKRALAWLRYDFADLGLAANGAPLAVDHGA